MLRKQIIGVPPDLPVSLAGRIDVAAVATVLVTSEDADHPVDHAFDGSSGPGGTRWVAGEPGEQTLILAFDAPQAIRRVVLEVEEREVARTQDLQVAVSTEGGTNYGRCSGRSTTSARPARPSRGRTGRWWPRA